MCIVVFLIPFTENGMWCLERRVEFENAGRVCYAWQRTEITGVCDYHDRVKALKIAKKERDGMRHSCERESATLVWAESLPE